jgi:hypothetical protein
MSPFERSQRAFDTEELVVLQTAYEAACQDLNIIPDESDGGAGDDKRHVLAEALLEAAKSGERNPSVLKTQALLYLKASVG